jgi:amidase
MGSNQRVAAAFRILVPFDHSGGLRDPRTQIGPMARWVEDLFTVFSRSWPAPIGSTQVWWPMPLGHPDQISLHELKVASYDALAMHLAS